MTLAYSCLLPPLWSCTESCRMVAPNASHPPSPLFSHCCHHLQLGIPESPTVRPTSLPTTLPLTAPPHAQLWLHGCTQHRPQMPSAFPFLPLLLPFSLLSFFLFKSHHFFEVWWKLAFYVVPASENKQVTDFPTNAVFSVAKLPAAPGAPSWRLGLAAPCDGKKIMGLGS